MSREGSGAKGGRAATKTGSRSNPEAAIEFHERLNPSPAAGGDGKAASEERSRATLGIPGSPYLTTVEAAAYCRYDTPFGLLKAHARGLVKGYRRGRTWLWRREDLDAFLERGTEDAEVVERAPRRAPARVTWDATPAAPRRTAAEEAVDLAAAIARVRAVRLRRKRQKRPSHHAGFCYIAPHADPR